MNATTTLYYVRAGIPAETLLFLGPAHENDSSLALGMTYRREEAERWAAQARAEGLEAVEVAAVEAEAVEL